MFGWEIRLILQDFSEVLEWRFYKMVSKNTIIIIWLFLRNL